MWSYIWNIITKTNKSLYLNKNVSGLSVFLCPKMFVSFVKATGRYFCQVSSADSLKYKTWEAAIFGRLADEGVCQHDNDLFINFNL